MNFDQTIQDLERLQDAVKNFTETVGVCQTFGPDAIPEHLACGEANVFAELLDALGITEEAKSLREWHLESEQDEDANEMHPDWS